MIMDFIKMCLVISCHIKMRLTVVEFHVPAVPAGAKLADLHTSRLAQPAPKDWGTSRHGDAHQSCHDIEGQPPNQLRCFGREN